MLENARGREAVVVVAVRDNHKRIRGGFSVFFFNPFLSLVKRFHIRLCDFSDKSFLFFFFFSFFFHTILDTLIR